MNQCVYRDFGILLVVVIYIAFTVEGVGFGVNFSSGESCDDPNTACPGSGTLVCGCAATYYRKSDNTACAPIVTTLAGTCDLTDTAAEQCSFPDTECTAYSGGGICDCKATHYADGTDCQHRIAFGGNCSGSIACVGDNTECDGSNNCVCSSTFYRNSVNTACVLIVTDLAGTCDITDTAPEQCSFADTQCTADGGGGTCMCKATHYSDGTDCQTSKTYNQACSNAITDTKQCGEANQECLLESGTSNYKCQCSAAYNYDGSGCTASSGVVKFASWSYMYVVPILVSMMVILQ